MRCMGVFRLSHCLGCRQYLHCQTCALLMRCIMKRAGSQAILHPAYVWNIEVFDWHRYSFAAATADVWHQQVDYTANLVPGYGPIGGRPQ